MSPSEADRPSRMDRDAFVKRFEGVFEHSPWIPGQAWDRGLGPDAAHSTSSSPDTRYSRPDSACRNSATHCTVSRNASGRRGVFAKKRLIRCTSRSSDSARCISASSSFAFATNAIIAQLRGR